MLLIRGYKFIIICIIYFNIYSYKCKAEFWSVFDNSTCNRQCKTHVHTMCKDIKPATSCKYKTRVYNINSFHETNMKKGFILGHNGLRDRIAHRMGIVDMRTLSWDKDLELMAINFATLCTPFEDDECLYSKIFKMGETRGTKNEYLQGKDSQLFMSQNRYCMVSSYFPRDLNILAMHEWYFDKNDLEPPRRISGPYSQEYKVLEGANNNFTHLAYEITYRFGCSLARYDNYYCAFCFYYPFFRSEGDALIYKTGKTASDCPSDFPYKHEKFRNLCTGSENDLASPCIKFVRLNRLLLILAAFLFLYMFKKMYT